MATPNPPLKASGNNPGDVRRLEQACLSAWPPLREDTLGGWRVRFGDGYTRRANSVQSLGAVEEDPLTAIALCESAYRAEGHPCVFKMTPLAQPEDLDSLLGARGYGTEGRTSVQTLDMGPDFEGPESPVPPPAETSAPRLLPPGHPDWLQGFFRLDGTPARHHETMAAILARIEPSHIGIVIEAGGQVVSCGRAVAEDGLVGLFDLATDPALRGRGLATTLIAALLDWGRSRGAAQAYLQVEMDNEPARRLYHHLGFRERYRYAYRVQGTG